VAQWCFLDVPNHPCCTFRLPVDRRFERLEICVPQLGKEEGLSVMKRIDPLDDV